VVLCGVETCRRHDIDPQFYFTQLLVNLPSWPASDIDAWLPDQWKQASSGRPMRGSGCPLSPHSVAPALHVPLTISVVMLRSRVFSKTTAYVGIAMHGVDLFHVIFAPFLPAASVVLMIIAGPLYPVWLFLVGRSRPRPDQ
jgi:hypothetical protein